jgi:type IV pilus assembly protein PilV
MPGMSTPPAFRPHRAAARRIGAHQRGVTLIEVMVAVLVFSFGLLGLVGLQARATQYSIGAEDANRASLLANEVVTTMWTSGTVTLSEDALEAWDARVADATSGGLPNGVGTVEVVDDVATVTIAWAPVGAASGVQHRYQTQVVLP